MDKPSLLIEVAIKIYLFSYFLVKNPKLLLLKTLIWRRYRKGTPGKRISSFEPTNERKLTEFYLTNWYLKPNLGKLESDIDSIMAVKNVKYNAIRTGCFDEKTYQVITDALKKGSKKAWESIILILEAMSFHFDEIRKIVFEMSVDSNGFIREIAILVMEEGSFSAEEKRVAYSQLSKDKNKKVRERVLDLIFREDKKHRDSYQDILDDLCKNDEDESIRSMACLIRGNEI